MNSNLSKKNIIQNFLKTELKNIPIKIIFHPDPTLVGIEGILIEESKNIFLIESNDHQIRVSKSHGNFGFIFQGDKITISGDLLIGTPKQRSKRKHKSW